VRKKQVNLHAIPAGIRHPKEDLRNRDKRRKTAWEA
jgi:hypothetical protein